MAPKSLPQIVTLALILALGFSAFPVPALAGSAAEVLPVKIHVIKFYLDPALVADMAFAKAVLPKYVADMNVILAKNTSRQFVFNPETGIVLTATKPQTDSAVLPLATEGFEIWAHAVRTENAISYGGYAGIDMSGAGVLAGLHWTRLYDPENLSAAQVPDYSMQIDHMLHELAHVFSAGIGEYYNLASITDTTETAPSLNININHSDDAFWSDKPDFMVDPLLRITRAVTRAEYLESVRYSNLTAAVISGTYRNGVLPFDRFTVQVLDENGQPVQAANVKAWNIKGAAPYTSTLLSDVLTDENGLAVIAWGGSINPHNNNNFLRLIKVSKDGVSIAAPKYVSIFDLDIAKLVSQSDSYTVNFNILPIPVEPEIKVETFTVTDKNNGWTLESAETSNKGGSLNASAATFQLGDDALNRQYKGILSFDTSSLPDNAVILSAVLNIKQAGKISGSNPYVALGNLLVDIRNGAFGTEILTKNDFQAAATVKQVAAFGKTPKNKWYSATLGRAGMDNLNKTGITQFRLYFSRDDNNNKRADLMKFFSGNSATDKPTITITYSIPVP